MSQYQGGTVVWITEIEIALVRNVPGRNFCSAMNLKYNMNHTIILYLSGRATLGIVQDPC